MTTATPFARAWRDAHPLPPQPRSIVALIADGTLDAELAAHLWLLIEARVPVLVAGGPRLAGKTTVLTALLEFLPAAVNRIVLRGVREDFAWLETADPARSVLLVSEISSHAPHYTWGPAARQAIRAAGGGFGLMATLHADSLEGVFAELRRPPVGARDDELSAMGAVLILGALPPLEPGLEPRRRVVAAHYVRPVARDAGGHVQRLGPAVLATLDRERDEFEHFGWGIIPELAFRVGRRAGDYESEHERRTAFLAGLVTADLRVPDDVARAIAGYTLAPAAATS